MSNLSESLWKEKFIKEFCFGDEQSILIRSKPIPLKWARYYVDCINFDYEKGLKAGRKWIGEIFEIYSEHNTLTTLQELVLDGDLHSAEYEINSLLSDFQEKSQIFRTQKSLLQYAVLTGMENMVEMLLTTGGFGKCVNDKDIVGGLTPAHIAVFTHNASILWILIRSGASCDIRDYFGCLPIEYARMMGCAPHYRSQWRDEYTIKVFDGKGLSELAVSKVEQMIKQTNIERSHFTWWFYYRASIEYIEEIFFYSSKIPKKQMEFREQYFGSLCRDSGDSQIVLGYIGENVGWGCYAARNFAKGEYIAQYVGETVVKPKSETRDYCMQSSLEDVVIDAFEYGNMASFINHSTNSNCEAQGVFENGLDRPIITALQDIVKGQQLLLDYGSQYFGNTKSVADRYEDMTCGLETREMPAFLPAHIIDSIGDLQMRTTSVCNIEYC